MAHSELQKYHKGKREGRLLSTTTAIDESVPPPLLVF